MSRSDRSNRWPIGRHRPAAPSQAASASVASSSALGRVARSAWRGWRDGWRGASPAARKRFWARLLTVTVLAAAASAGSALLLQGAAEDGRLPGDAAAADRIRELLSVHSAVWLGAFTSSAMVLPLLVLAAVLWARAGRWERVVTAGASFLASKAIILAGWTSWARERPADVASGALVPAEMSSYPSGHTVQTWTVYGLMVVWWAASTDRRWERALAWVLLLAGSAVIGAGRVRIGAHHPSDILGGTLLGVLWLAGAAWAERAAREGGTGRRSRAPKGGSRGGIGGRGSPGGGALDAGGGGRSRWAGRG